MKALIDTNVLIDVIQSREPFCQHSKRIFQLAAEGKIEGYVSVQSLKDIFYVCKRSCKEKSPFEPIEQISFLFSIIDVTGEDSLSALMSDISDYEDALLVHSAQRNGINVIITRNKHDFQDSHMVAVDPSEIDDYLGREFETGCVIIGSVPGK